MNILQLFLTIYFWSLAIPVVLITFILCLLIYPFTDQKTFARFFELSISKTMLYVMTIPGFWSITIYEDEDIDWSKQYVIVANHLSFVDSMVLSFIPLKKKFILAEIFSNLPVFGWLTKMAGYIPANKHNPVLNRSVVDKAVEAIKKDNSSMCLFPEGLRELLPYKFETFKTGAYRIAQKSNLEILPITLINCEKAMGFYGIVGLGSIKMIINKPFYVDSSQILNNSQQSDKDLNNSQQSDKILYGSHQSEKNLYSFYIEKTKDIMISNLKLDGIQAI